MTSLTTPLTKINEINYLAPLTEVLEKTNPNETLEPSASDALKQSLDNLFPEQQYTDKTLQKAKEMLGDVAKAFTEEQLRDVVCEVQFLATSWLDDFERGVFEGKTLNELLHEKGGT
jgi:hypothetical protein